MLSYRLGTVNDFHWGFKPVLSYSKQLLLSWQMFLGDILFYTRLVTCKQYTWLLLVLRDSPYYSKTLIYKFWFGKSILGDLLI